MIAPLPDPDQLRRIGLLSRTVAHDFNNFLGAILGYSSLLSSRLEPGSAGQRQAGKIEMAANDASAKTNNLLAFGRMWTMPPSRMPLEFSLLQEEIAHRLKGGGDQPVAEVHAERIESGVRVAIDPQHLHRGIEAIATNACEAQRGAEPPRIDVRFAVVESSALSVEPPSPSPTDQWFQIIISDPGVGMDEETLAQIGEPGFSSHQDVRHQGLGVPIAHGFAHSHGGALQIDSTAGEGTVVTLWLPVASV
jgi:two-component system, cell cycle sensor histidine kinase and response regulator CckA